MTHKMVNKNFFIKLFYLNIKFCLNLRFDCNLAELESYDLLISSQDPTGYLQFRLK